MITITTIEDLHSALQNVSGTVGFVPTMGALHAGHISLVKQAKSSTDLVVVSVFVNPTQFNDKQDFTKYPRTLEADSVLLEAAGVDIVFAPSPEEIYPKDQTNQPDGLNLNGLDTVMEGASRPGHFNGVVQVVNRLFDIVEPELAFFGEKDYQQLAIIKKLAAWRNYDVQIECCPIVRGDDGLALSSRNALLGSDARKVAPFIHKVLQMATAKNDTPVDICKWAKEHIENHSAMFKVDYITIADENTLQEQNELTSDSRIFAAVYCDNIRLIDNLPMQCL